MTAAQGLRSTAGIRPAYLRATVPLEVGTVPRTGLPWRPYAYRGTGEDTLTPPELSALLDAEPDDGPPLSKGMDRYLLADVGHLSASQAAAALGVAERTICRYRAALRAVRGGSVIALWAGGVIGAAALAGGVIFILRCVAEAMRGPADVGGCAWCKPLGRYADISTLPSDCVCDEACEAAWCQRQAVRRP